VEARLLEVPRRAVRGVGLEGRPVAHRVEGPLLAALVGGGDAVVVLIDRSERSAPVLLQAIQAVVGGARRRAVLVVEFAERAARGVLVLPVQAVGVVVVAITELIDVGVGVWMQPSTLTQGEPQSLGPPHPLQTHSLSRRARSRIRGFRMLPFVERLLILF
jgi:hypothetical protein